MTRTALGALLVLAACVDGFPSDSDTDDSGSDDGCPEGMHGARDPGMFIQGFTFDGLSRNPLFEDVDVDGRPAGCIGDTGNSIDYIFLLLGEPYGRLAMKAPTADQSYDLNGTGSATVVITLFGEEGSPSFEAPEWVNGTWFVESVGTSFDSDMNGNALDDEGSHSMGIGLSVEGSL